MKKNTIYIFISVFSFVCFSQEKFPYKRIDSLEVLISKSEELRLSNDMYQALEYAVSIVNSANKLQNDHYLSHGYLLMGNIQYELIDYENATKNLLKSLEYSETTEEKVLLPYILHSLANVYYDDNNDYENALKYYKKAVELGKENPFMSQYQILLHNLIWVHLDLNEFEKATPYFKQADSIDKLKDVPQIDRSSLYLQKARNYSHYGNIEKAQEYFKKSYELLEKETFWPKGKSYFYQYRSQMYQNIGDYSKSIEDLKKLRENDRKIFENAKIKNQEITKIRFKVDQYEQKLKVAKREKELLLDIDKNNKTIIFISSAALFLLAGVVFFYYRGYRSKKKISEILKTKNAELYEAKSQAEKLSKIKSQFISTISHELRTPLYGVVGISSILMENESRSEKDKKLLKSLRFSADYLLDLVNKVLKVSKIDSQKNELIKTPTNLFSLSQNIIQSFEYQLEKKEIELILDYDHEIPKMVDIDAIRISEVLINLLGNAIKFTHNGRIWLRIKLVSSTTKEAKIRLEVEDTGVGIPEDQKEYIFEEFSQVGSVYDNKQGTGLGLSIVKNLVQVMGGQVHFESKKGIGSIFYFEIDVEVSKSTIEQSNIAEKSKPSEKITAKILVAEDNKVNQLVTKNLLKNIGCDCTIVENGIEAVEILKKEKFDLVLMDINMPVMDGMQATQNIRNSDQKTPIIALTASELSEVADECKKAGMNDLINKPLNKKDLSQIIQKNLNY